jgi:hypothetical protein
MQTKEELITGMHNQITKLKEAKTQDDREFRFNLCKGYYDQCEVIRACYYYDKYAPMTEAFKVKPIINSMIMEDNVTFKKRGGYTLPVYTLGCLNFDNEHFPGLYFNGDIKSDPNYGILHCVKIGGGNDISKRVKQYMTYNPMIYHNETAIRIEDWQHYEPIAQAFIAKYALGVPSNGDEWYIVDEETYYKMCELFSDPVIFRKIAQGKRATL